jgi:predicted P-loop ATPase
MKTMNRDTFIEKVEEGNMIDKTELQDIIEKFNMKIESTVFNRSLAEHLLEHCDITPKPQVDKYETKVRGDGTFEIIKNGKVTHTATIKSIEAIIEKDEALRKEREEAKKLEEIITKIETHSCPND